jgi:O-antigen/teichoic acid export membrane protein
MKVAAAFICNVLFNFIVGLAVAKFLGPAEYGRFALALATAMAVQTAFFDWLRLGATRFYSERARLEDPALRATLDVCFATITLGLTVGGCFLALLGLNFTLSHELIYLGMGAAVANGLFDYNTALVRARFHDGLYTRLIVVKNLFAFCLTGGGALIFHSAEATLIGSIISIAGSVVTARAALNDPSAQPRLARWQTTRALMSYGLPIVGANLLYMTIPLANRSLAAIFYGFSETGQFSLAFDMGTKAVQAIGSTLDLILFQIAVAAQERFGAAEARAQIARNMTIVIAVLLPTCTGIWLVLPSIQRLIVPEQYQGPFGELLTQMLVGLFAFALILYGLNPIFQIAKRTLPLIAAALVGCLTDAALVAFLPRGADATGLAFAQTGAFVAALATLSLIAGLSKPQWPRWRDIALAVLASAAMTAALLPLRERAPGFVTLVLQVGVGIAIYGALVFSFDIAGLRTLVRDRMRPLMMRLSGALR